MPPPAPPLPCNDVSPLMSPTGALNAIGIRLADTCTIWLEFEGDFGMQLMGLGSAQGHTGYSFGIAGDLELGVQYTKVSQGGDKATLFRGDTQSRANNVIAPHAAFRFVCFASLFASIFAHSSSDPWRTAAGGSQTGIGASIILPRRQTSPNSRPMASPSSSPSSRSSEWASPAVPSPSIC